MTISRKMDLLEVGLDGSSGSQVSVGVVFTVPHEGLVVGHELVLKPPAGAAVVLEAGQVPAKVGALPDLARGAEGVAQVRVNLHFFGELRCLDFYEGC